MSQYWTDVPFGDGLQAVSNLLSGAGPHGGRVLGKLKDTGYAKKVAWSIAADTVREHPLHERARAIMGRSFFGVPENVKYFGVHPLSLHLGRLDQDPFPFSDETLALHVHSHFLVAFFPLSIIELIKKLEDVYPVFGMDRWYEREGFANAPVKCRWALIRKGGIKNTQDDTLKGQRKELRPDESAASAPVLFYSTLAWLLLNKEPLFHNNRARSATVDVPGSTHAAIVVREDKLYIEPCRDDEDSSYLRLGSMRTKG